RPGIELRNQVDRDADVVKRGGRQHRRRRHTRAAAGSRAVGGPAHAWKLSTRELGDPTVARRGWCAGPVGEGRRPHARHARPWEVGRLHSTGEADEQREGPRKRTRNGGGGGGKATDQGKRDAGDRVPDAEPDRRDERTAERARGGTKGEECAVHRPAAP